MDNIISYLSAQISFKDWINPLFSHLEGKPAEDLTAKDFQDYLSHLAVQKMVSPSTQNHALNALVFLFRHILNKDLDDEISAVRARRKQRLHLIGPENVSPLWSLPGLSGKSDFSCFKNNLGKRGRLLGLGQFGRDSL